MNEIIITKDNFHQEVINSEKTVLMDFWATWCGPCRMIAPILEEIAQEREDIIVGKINVDEEPALANQFKIMSIPTLILMDKGQIVSQSVGAAPKNKILTMLP